MTAAPYRLHSDNKSFAWQEGRKSGLRRLTPEQKAKFDRDGFFILKNAFTRADVAAVEMAIDPLEREHEQFIRDNSDAGSISSADAVTFTGHLVKKSLVLKRFATHPAICEVCYDLIGDDVRLYWDQSVYKKSGKPREFPWHQDNGYTFVEPQQYLTFWIPLVDVDVENGCPWIAPGLHKLGTLAHWATPIGYKCLEEAIEAMPAEAKIGDVIVFSSLAPHRTGPNLKRGTVRKAYILQYAPEGVIAITRDGQRLQQNDPERQFLILRNGERACSTQAS